MNLFDKLLTALKRAFHVRAAQVKGTPFVAPGHEQAVADAINAVVGSKIDAVLAAGPAAAENALHVHADTLKGIPGVTDHQAAADHINQAIAQVLQAP